MAALAKQVKKDLPGIKFPNYLPSKRLETVSVYH